MALEKARNHERINTLLKQEKVKLKDDLENLYSQINQQSKDLREALQAKKLASQDHSDMTLKLVQLCKAITFVDGGLCAFRYRSLQIE